MSSMVDETTPSRPSSIDRYLVVSDVFIVIFSTTAVCLYVSGGRYAFWMIVALVIQIYWAASSGYRLFRVIRKRITGR